MLHIRFLGASRVLCKSHSSFAFKKRALQSPYIEGSLYIQKELHEDPRGFIHIYIHMTILVFFLRILWGASQNLYTEEASQIPCTEEFSCIPQNFSHTEEALQRPIHVHKVGFTKPLLRLCEAPGSFGGFAKVLHEGGFKKPIWRLL